jgi:hypothetical protein
MPRTRGQRWALLGLVAYGLALAVVLLHPNGSVPSTSLTWLTDAVARVGGPSWLLVPGRMDFVTNALVFVPVAVLGSLALHRTTWRDWTAYVFVASALVETTQALALAERSATFSDVASNTLGALLGAVGAVAVRRYVRRRARDGGPVTAD